MRHAPTAPGTTVIAPSRASARRSRFCAVIYSSACHLVTMFTRLPTLALPATAASLSSAANQRASRAIVSGSNWVSASSAITISLRASASPWFRARALPPFSSVSSLTRESPPNARSTTCEVESFDPSSMTITSTTTSWLASTCATERSITRSSLKAGISTLTKVAGSIAGRSLRRSLAAASSPSPLARPLARRRARSPLRTGIRARG